MAEALAYTPPAVIEQERQGEAHDPERTHVVSNANVPRVRSHTVIGTGAQELPGYYPPIPEPQDLLWYKIGGNRYTLATEGEGHGYTSKELREGIIFPETNSLSPQVAEPVSQEAVQHMLFDNQRPVTQSQEVFNAAKRETQAQKKLYTVEDVLKEIARLEYEDRLKPRPSRPQQPPSLDAVKQEIASFPPQAVLKKLLDDLTVTIQNFRDSWKKNGF